MTVGDGIHVLQVLETARSQAGKTLHEAFRSRFRVGGAENVIIRADTPGGYRLTDDGLVEVVAADTGDLLFHHQATGASWVRLRLDQGAWGPLDRLPSGHAVEHRRRSGRANPDRPILGRWQRRLFRHRADSHRRLKVHPSEAVVKGLDNFKRLSKNSSHAARSR